MKKLLYLRIKVNNIEDKHVSLNYKMYTKELHRVGDKWAFTFRPSAMADKLYDNYYDAMYDYLIFNKNV